MSNENPAASATPANQPLIEPAPAHQNAGNPWKVSTFVVGGAGLALAILTGVTGLAVGNAAAHHGDFGPGDRGNYSADGPGWGMDDSGPGGRHGERGRHGDRDRGSFDDRDGRGMGGPGMMDDDDMPGMQGAPGTQEAPSAPQSESAIPQG